MSSQSPEPPPPEKAPEPVHVQPPNKLYEWAAAAAIMMFLSMIAYMFWSFLSAARL